MSAVVNVYMCPECHHQHRTPDEWVAHMCDYHGDLDADRTEALLKSVAPYCLWQPSEPIPVCQQCQVFATTDYPALRIHTYQCRTDDGLPGNPPATGRVKSTVHVVASSLSTLSHRPEVDVATAVGLPITRPAPSASTVWAAPPKAAATISKIVWPTPPRAGPTLPVPIVPTTIIVDTSMFGARQARQRSPLETCPAPTPADEPLAETLTRLGDERRFTARKQQNPAQNHLIQSQRYAFGANDRPFQGARNREKAVPYHSRPADFSRRNPSSTSRRRHPTETTQQRSRSSTRRVRSPNRACAPPQESQPRFELAPPRRRSPSPRDDTYTEVRRVTASSTTIQAHVSHPAVVLPVAPPGDQGHLVARAPPSGPAAMISTAPSAAAIAPVLTADTRRVLLSSPVEEVPTITGLLSTADTATATSPLPPARLRAGCTEDYWNTLTKTQRRRKGRCNHPGGFTSRKAYQKHRDQERAKRKLESTGDSSQQAPVDTKRPETVVSVTSDVTRPETVVYTAAGGPRIEGLAAAAEVTRRGVEQLHLADAELSDYSDPDDKRKRRATNTSQTRLVTPRLQPELENLTIDVEHDSTAVMAFDGLVTELLQAQATLPQPRFPAALRSMRRVTRSRLPVPVVRRDTTLVSDHTTPATEPPAIQMTLPASQPATVTTSLPAVTAQAPVIMMPPVTIVLDAQLVDTAVAGALRKRQQLPPSPGRPRRTRMTVPPPPPPKKPEVSITAPPPVPWALSPAAAQAYRGKPETSIAVTAMGTLPHRPFTRRITQPEPIFHLEGRVRRRDTSIGAVESVLRLERFPTGTHAQFVGNFHGGQQTVCAQEKEQATQTPGLVPATWPSKFRWTAMIFDVTKTPRVFKGYLAWEWRMTPGAYQLRDHDATASAVIFRKSTIADQ